MSEKKYLNKKKIFIFFIIIIFFSLLFLSKNSKSIIANEIRIVTCQPNLTKVNDNIVNEINDILDAFLSGWGRERHTAFCVSGKVFHL